MCVSASCVCGRRPPREREGGEAEERGGVAEGEEVRANEEADGEREFVDTSPLLLLLLTLPMEGIQTLTQTRQPPAVLGLRGLLPPHIAADTTAMWCGGRHVIIALAPFPLGCFLPLRVVFLLGGFLVVGRWSWVGGLCGKGSQKMKKTI